MSRVECFMLEPTNRVELRLRRFTFSSGGIGPSEDCPGGPMGGHDAWLPFHGDWPARMREDGCLMGYEDVAPPHDDPRWPTKCGQCGAPFPEFATWQVFQELIYRRADNGLLTTLRDAPPGAMYDAEWYPAKGPDGRSLCVCLPPEGGLDYWCIDDIPNGGTTPWQRTGIPPKVTASPSILTPRYHGWLRDGFLVEC